jgi:hypothetical protein
MKQKYRAFESWLARYTETEAWVFGYDDLWGRASGAEVLMWAGVMTEEQFNAVYGKLSPLLEEAFKIQLPENLRDVTERDLGTAREPKL